MYHSLYFINKFAVNSPFLDYVVYDYTGYGKSKIAEINHNSICRDLELVIKYLNLPNDQIILWGFSLGTYPTTVIAKKYKVKGVVLLSPLASIYSLFTDNLTSYSTFKNDCFSVLQNISELQSYLVIIHSSGDEIIPFKHAKIIFQRYRMLSSNPYCFLIEVSSLKHNQMHKYLCSPNSNSLKDAFINYLKEIVNHKQGETAKSQYFQLQKFKYFQNLDDMEQSQVINLDQQLNLQSEPAVNSLMVNSSFEFANLKDNTFNVPVQDNVESEETFNFSDASDIKNKHHVEYFSPNSHEKHQFINSYIEQNSQIWGKD